MIHLYSNDYLVLNQELYENIIYSNKDFIIHSQCPHCGNCELVFYGHYNRTVILGTMSRIRTHLIDTFFIFKTSFVIVRRFIVTMTVNPNCIVKCFDIFKYHLVCHLIINDLFSIQPLSFN